MREVHIIRNNSDLDGFQEGTKSFKSTKRIVMLKAFAKPCIYSVKVIFTRDGYQKAIYVNAFVPLENNF